MGGEERERTVLASLDAGTQSTRCFLYDSATLEVVSSHQLSHAQLMPQAGWVEHNPLELAECARACLEGAVAAAPLPLRVLGLGVTTQRETTVLWCKRTGQPLCNAIVWLDTRTTELCRRLTLQFGREHFQRVSGLPIATYFSAYKMLWALENVASVREAAAEGRLAFGTVDSWLLYQLTDGAVHATDVTNASRTGLMELSSRSWHAPTLAALGISQDWLPAIRSSAELFGHVARGTLAGVPICGCLGDQQAAMLGHRCRPGEAKNTYGTGCFVLLNTGSSLVHSSHGLLTTVAFQLGPSAPPQYALEGSIAIAGAGVSWLCDNLGIISEAREVEALAASVPDTAGVSFVPAFGGLLAPYWRDDARGCICGLTQFSTRAHIARALLESIAFQTRDVLEAMYADASLSRVPLSQLPLRVDGGASSNQLLMQMQADALGRSVVRPVDAETTALGAALAAGVALQLWTAEELFRCERAGGVTFEPRAEEWERRAGHERWQAAVKKSFST